jgi:flagellar basal-body rod modification protein FlgD
MNINALLKVADATVPGATAVTTGTSGTTGATATSATTGSASSAATAAKDASDRFLTLLVAQLQNQDPLNPLDNAQVTTQLAQISTVSGINQLNDTVAALGASMGISQYLQAANLVGHDVVLGGNDIGLVEGKGHGGVQLSGDADHVTVAISDEAGNVVRTLDLGAQKGGTRFFDWDGKTDSGSAAPEGHYTFAVTATAAGKAVPFDTLMHGTVEGIVSTPGGALLQLDNGTQIAFDAVKQIH